MHHRAIAPAVLTALIVSASFALAAPGAPGHSHKTFAAGAPGDPKKPARTVGVVMKETDDGKMLFVPDQVEAKRGEQIRFALRTSARSITSSCSNSVERNAKHKIEMQKNPDMEHDDPNGKRLAPGGTSEIVWRFSKAGTFEFACLIPGHYESGMHGKAIVKGATR